MKWFIDLDGVITSNPCFFEWFTYQLKKKGNNNEVVILTARNPVRKEETVCELNKWGISYDSILSMDDYFDRGLGNLGIWKRNMVLEHKPDIWIENEIKAYKAVGVNFDSVEKITNIINI